MKILTWGKENMLLTKQEVSFSDSRLAKEFASQLLITLFFLLPGDRIVSWYLSSFPDPFVQLILLLYL